MAIRLTGLGGFDSSGVIDQLVDIARQPLRALDTKVRNLDSAKATLTAFSSKLAALKTAALALSTPTGFSSMSATSSDTAIVASVTGAAVTGSYGIEVTQLARVQKSRTAELASASTALGQSGDVTIQIGSTTKTISLVATDTLTDVATKISGSGARVIASVLSTGTGYRLVVQGLDTGAANAFSITENGPSLGLAQYEDARDASLTIDGLPITRPTNQIADAIPGVTFALTKTTTAKATLSMTGDPAALKTKIEAFVTAYNDVVSSGHSAAGWGSQKATNAVLAGDTSVRRALDRISSLATGAVTGASSTMRSLISAGVSIAKDGRMSLDATKLDAVMKSDPLSVQRLFVLDSSLGMTGVMKTIADTIDGLVTSTTGAVKARIDSLGAQSKRLSDSRTTQEKRVEQYETQLRKQYADLDVAMSRYQTMAGALSGIGSGSGSTG
jgi:flagellar hook-associated protein 2